MGTFYKAKIAPLRHGGGDTRTDGRTPRFIYKDNSNDACLGNT